MTKFLTAMNILPKKQDSFGYWYLSPLRSEKTPSFKVNPKLNTWYDFGLKQGGTIIDFVMTKWNRSFYDALQFLAKKNYTNISLEQLPTKERTSTIKQIVRVDDTVKNYLLLEYLLSRAVSPEKVKGLIGEIYYKLGDNPRTYYGLAFKNDKGDFEIRNKYFKGCTGKYFTTIKNGYDSITVFEGFMDFLSLNCHRAIKSDVLVLNSCMMMEKAIPIIQSYSKTYLMMDNDDTGNHYTKMIMDYVEAKDCRHLYTGFNDVNEWLTSQNKY